MKIGIMSGAYIGRYGWEIGPQKMADHGYEAVDYQAFANTNRPLFSLSERDFEATLKQERAAMERAGIEIYQAHGPWRYPILDFTAQQRAERFEKMAKSIRGCAILGCKHLVIHNIMPYGNRDLSRRTVLEINRDFIGRLAEIGQEYGVIVCMENMPFLHQCLATPDALFSFVREMNIPHLRLCLDTGHCAVRGISPADAVRQWGKEYLYTLHVHDNNGRRDQHLPPEQGVIDWADLTKALAEIGYEGVFSLETAVPGSIVEGRENEEIALAKTALRLAGR